jgi:hypothetical protein
MMKVSSVALGDGRSNQVCSDVDGVEVVLLEVVPSNGSIEASEDD